MRYVRYSVEAILLCWLSYSAVVFVACPDAPVWSPVVLQEQYGWSEADAIHLIFLLGITLPLLVLAVMHAPRDRRNDR